MKLFHYFFELRIFQLCYLVLVLLFINHHIFSQTNPNPQRLLQNSNQNYFIENNGQWPNEVLYLTQMNGMDAWITKTGVVYDYYKIEESYSTQDDFHLSEHQRNKKEHKNKLIIGHVIKMIFDGANINPESNASEREEGYYNYFIGNDERTWASFVQLYKTIEIGEIYKGINVRYYYDVGRLRYDYLIKPQANVNDIEINLEGADTEINESGEIIIKTSIGEVTHGRLYAYQEEMGIKNEVKCKFKNIGDKKLTISVEEYDKSKEIIIDPLVYSTFIGGSGSDESYDIDIDASGNAYVTGFTNSTDYPVTSGAYQTNYDGGEWDAFITKINQNGTALIYSTFIGGSNSEGTFDYPDIAVDGSGNAYITGETNSLDYPVTSGAFQTNYGGGEWDAFITKINQNGSALIYSTFIGGNSQDISTSIAIDASGNAVIAGFTASTDYPVTSGAFQTTIAGYNDIFVTKINQDGNALLYSTFLGGDGDDWTYSIAIDGNGNSYITGNTYSFNYPVTSGAYSTTKYFGLDALVTKLNQNGSALIYSTFIGGTDEDWVYAIAIDVSNNAYITGSTNSLNYPVTSGAFQTEKNYGYDIFVTKINQGGSALLYSTFIGGNYEDWSHAIDIDGSGNAYVTGRISSSDYPVTSGAYQITYGGYSDAFITKLNQNGNALVYSTYIGGAGEDWGYAIAIDGNGDAFITGFTLSTDYPVTNGAFQTTIGAEWEWDSFVTKLSLENPILPNINLQLVSPSSINEDNYFREAILLDENRLILAPYIYLNEIPSNSLQNIKVEAYLDDVPLNIQLNTLTRNLDSDQDGLIDFLPQIPNNGDLGVRFLIYSDLLTDNLPGANVKMVITEIDGNQVNIFWEKPVSYFYAKTNQYPSFRLDRDSYKFENLGKLSWQEFLTLTFNYSPFPNLLLPLFVEGISWGGRCWGMAATSGSYFLYPNSKIYQNNNVFDWEPTDPVVTSAIAMNHYNQIIYIPAVITSPSNAEAYQNLLEYFMENKPSLLRLPKKNEDGNHAVLTTALTIVEETAFFKIYDSNAPYNSAGAGFINYDYNLITSEFGTGELYSYDRFQPFSNDIFLLPTNVISWTKLFTKITDLLYINGTKQFCVGCPVNLLITNSLGQRYGFDSYSNFINEIPSCSHIKVPTSEGASDSVTIIYAPQNDNYEVRFYSYNSGEMLFALNKAESENQLYTVFSDSIGLTSSTIGYFNETLLTNQLVLDYDGDGQPDTSITLTQNIITSTQDLIMNTAQIPDDYKLLQNHPNPFNPITVISYSLPCNSFIQLKIFNTLGKEIVTLINEEKPSGTYELTWNAENLPSGVYFYRLQAGDFVQTRKMILLK